MGQDTRYWEADHAAERLEVLEAIAKAARPRCKPANTAKLAALYKKLDMLDEIERTGFDPR